MHSIRMSLFVAVVALLYSIKLGPEASAQVSDQADRTGKVKTLTLEELWELELANTEPPIIQTRPRIQSPEQMEATVLRLRIDEVKRAADGTLEYPSSAFFSLLNDPRVVIEIGLNPKKQTVIGAIDRSLREACRRSILTRLEFVEQPIQEQETREESGRRYRRKLAEEAARLVCEGVLDRQQANRVKHLQWRHEGLEAIANDPELAHEIGLSPSQQSQFRQRYAHAKALKVTPPGEIADLRIAAMTSLQEDPDRRISNGAYAEYLSYGRMLDDQVWALLTRQRRARYLEVLGPPLTGDRPAHVYPSPNQHINKH